MYPRVQTPKSQVDVHPRITAQLHALAQDPAALPHLLLYGPHGCGKRTRFNTLLKALHPEPFELTCTTLHLKIPPHKKNRGDNEIKATVVTSPHHVEIVLDQLSYHNIRDALQAILQHLSAGRHQSNLTQARYQCVMLHNVDQLPIPAQLALRRSMETLVSTCRFLMTATNMCRVNEALKSRCVCMRVPIPVDPNTNLIRITVARELKAATQAQPVVREPWKRYVDMLIGLVQKNKTLLPFARIRKALYELLSRGIRPEAILNAIVDKAIDDAWPSTQREALVAWIAHSALDVTAIHDSIFYLESFMRRLHLILSA